MIPFAPNPSNPLPCPGFEIYSTTEFHPLVSMPPSSWYKETMIKKDKCCYKCLAKEPNAQDCELIVCDKCKTNKHHTLPHKESTQWLLMAYKGISAPHPIVAAMIELEGRFCQTYALLDSGANCCDIRYRIVHKLNIEIRNLLDLSRHNKQEMGCKPTASFKVHSLDGRLTLKIDNGIVGRFIASLV